jgi:hypothetical protein
MKMPMTATTNGTMIRNQPNEETNDSIRKLPRTRATAAHRQNPTETMRQSREGCRVLTKSIATETPNPAFSA